jgi:hypothetical protein
MIADSLPGGEPGIRDEHMISFTLPEIRRLLVYLLLQHDAPAEHVPASSPRRPGRRGHRHREDPASLPASELLRRTIHTDSQNRTH